MCRFTFRSPRGGRPPFFRGRGRAETSAYPPPGGDFDAGRGGGRGWVDRGRGGYDRGRGWVDRGRGGWVDRGRGGWVDRGGRGGGFDRGRGWVDRSVQSYSRIDMNCCCSVLFFTKQ